MFGQAHRIEASSSSCKEQQHIVKATWKKNHNHCTKQIKTSYFFEVTVLSISCLHATMTNKRNSYLVTRCTVCGTSLHPMTFRNQFLCCYFSWFSFFTTSEQRLHNWTSLPQSIINSDSFQVIMICITSLLAEGEAKVYTQRFSQITSS